MQRLPGWGQDAECSGVTERGLGRVAERCPELTALSDEAALRKAFAESRLEIAAEQERASIFSVNRKGHFSLLAYISSRDETTRRIGKQPGSLKIQLVA